MKFTFRKEIKSLLTVSCYHIYCFACALRPGHLKSALSEYISRIDGVKLIRSNKRLGVIGGRMLGAARATGEILVFMDPHCECHPGWLEPLLSRIMNNR